MAEIQCNFCFNYIEVDPQWQVVRCPYCNNTFQVVLPGNNAPVPQTQYFQPEQAAYSTPQPQSQFSVPNIYLQQQDANTLITNGDYNTLFELVIQAMMSNNVSIKTSDPATGTISGNAPYGINPFGMSVNCHIYGQAGSAMVKFQACFTDSFDTFGACRQKISEIISCIMSQSQILQSAAVTSVAPAMSQYNSPSSSEASSLASNGRICGILGFFIPLASWIGLVLSIIALSKIPAGDKATRSIAQTGLILSIIAIVLNFIAGIILFVLASLANF